MISRFWVLRISCRFVSGTSAAKLTSNSLVTTIVSLMPDRERTGNDCLTKVGDRSFGDQIAGVVEFGRDVDEGEICADRGNGQVGPSDRYRFLEFGF